MTEERLKQIGWRIKKERNKQKYSQTELGFHCNQISQTMISKYESGEKAPSLRQLERLSIALRVSTDYLLKGI